MNSDELYQKFIKENRIRQNKTLNRVIWFCLFVGPGIAVGVFLGAFPYINYHSCAMITLLVALLAEVQLLIIRYDSESVLAAYVGLFAVLVLLGFMAKCNVGIYLTFFVVPLMSLFYCDTTIYLITSIASYIAMLVINWLIADFSASLRPDLTPFGWWIGQIGGYTIEYLVMFLTGRALNRAIIERFKNLFSTKLEADTEKEQTEAMFRLARTDALTGMGNRLAFNEDIDSFTESGINGPFSIILSDVNGLKKANDSFGHLAGDELLIGASRCIENVFSPFGKCYRIGGDEFAMLLNVDGEELDTSLARFNAIIESWRGTNVAAMSISYGFASRCEFPDEDIGSLLHTADRRMYEAKAAYYRKNDRRCRS